MKAIKKYWLIVNIPMNSPWLSTLTYSRKNLTIAYRTKNTIVIFPGFILPVLICFRNKIFVMINITSHSPKLAKKLGLTLKASSTCVYILKIFVFSAKVVIRVGNHRASAGTGIPYIS